MTWRKYVLETAWTFDHSNTDYVTLTDEGDYNLENLFDPTAGEMDRSLKMDTIRRLCDLQNGNPMDRRNCKPVALYLVVGPNRPFEETGLPTMVDLEGGEKLLSFGLKLVGTFDKQGLPVFKSSESLSKA